MATVRSSLNQYDQITPEQKARLQMLAEMPDDQIDFSDAPEKTDLSGFMTVEEVKVYRTARKTQTAAV